MRIDPKIVKPSSVASKISEIKDRADYLDGGDLSLLFPDYYTFSFADLFEKYHQVLANNRALDFNDLIIKCVELFRNHADVLEKLQHRWRYFMIDEYQDTNHAQYLIGTLLSKAGRNICVVGDDDQSIYSWRGADIRNILDFEKDFPDAKVIVLDENYRSTSQILDAATAVIRNNTMRKEKNLRAFKGEGEPVVYCRAANEYGEAEFVLNKILGFKNREGLSNRDFAIFYRTNAQSRVFEDVLRREQLSYRVVGGLKFYNRKEIKDLLYYLRFIVNTGDAVAMARIINTPARGIGKATLEKIQDAAYTHNLTEWELISRAGELGVPLSKGVEAFRDIILAGLGSVGDVPGKIKLADFVKEVFDATGYIASLKDERSVESRSRLENIEELINGIYDYGEMNPEAGLEQFLQDIALLTSEDDPEEQKDRDNAITLMTVHNAKGLEFPVVFLTGMEEEIFPHANSSDTEEGLEEERRLCYVGITRSMERIFLTSAEMRRRWGDVVYREPSRFIFEIPEELLEKTSFVSGPGPGGTRDFGRGGFGGAPSRTGLQRTPFYDDTSFEAEDEAPVIGESAASGFKVRDRVLHPRFGSGRVMRIEGAGDNVKLTIDFDGFGRKVFMEKYTPLEKVR
jgi:DNA helicase-2/ATP-dependent DNA helicase PcrA